MRTTLSIDDDVLEAARQIAAARRIPLGEAVSELARRGIARLRLRASAGGIQVFDTPPDFPPISGTDIDRILADSP